MAYGKVVMRDGDTVTSKRALTLSEAWVTAQRWVVGVRGRHADIVRYRDGKRVMSYWFDGRLQYLEY